MKNSIAAFLQSLRQVLSGHSPASANAAASPAARLVDHILRDAAERRASEIQVGWWTRAELGRGPGSELDNIVATMEDEKERGDSLGGGKEFAVRYRVAGELKTVMSLPRQLCPALLARLKEVAGLTPGARSLPSDPIWQASQNAPPGHICLTVREHDGRATLADFNTTIVREGQEETVMLSINYRESQAK